MNYNFHTHTVRCHHATGTPREYIERAIEGGIKYMGFSDHAPFCFPDGYEPIVRVRTDEAADYISELRSLREEYKDKIDIKIGFEMEYYPKYFDQMLKNVIDYGAEYLILGQHYVYNEHPDGISAFEETDKAEDLKAYADRIIFAAQSKYFSYIAHPDFIKFTGDIKEYKKEMRRVCIASRENNIPLEINFLGIRSNRNYPNPELWKIAGEQAAPVTFGFDAHDAESACDHESLKIAKKLVEDFKLNYIGMPNIINIQNI